MAIAERRWPRSWRCWLSPPFDAARGDRLVLHGLWQRLRTKAPRSVRRASFTPEQIRSHLGYDLTAMIGNGYDATIVAEHAGFNANVERFVTHPVFGRYLSSRLPEATYEASGVSVLALDDLASEIRDLAPDHALLPLGFFPIASSNGNLICFEASSNRVWWASHELRADDDPVGRLTPLGDDFWDLLRALDADRLTERFAAPERGA